MKTVAQFMSPQVITVRPTESVAAAVERLRTHGIGALPVVDNKQVVGIVTLEDLVGQPPYRPVREVMARPVATVSPSEWITVAYAQMDEHKVGRLAVVEDGTLVGIVTRADLLKELGRLTDPLTDLPWAGALRQHAADLLKTNREITMLFIDLDDFGIVNKLYGHVVGDRIIKAVADLVRQHADPATDYICRYAGDEFAIVTTRTLAGSTALARALRDAIVAINVAGSPPGAISASVGIAGGKRTTERHDIHHEATVDDLITLASRASTGAKQTESRILHGGSLHEPAAALEAGEGRVAIRRIDMGIEEGRGMAAVELEFDGRRVTGRAEGPVLGTGGLRLLVEATVGALRNWLPSQWEVAVEEITRTPLEYGEAVNILLITGSPSRAEHVLGSALYTADPHEAVVKATMKAMNRMLTRAVTKES